MVVSPIRTFSVTTVAVLYSRNEVNGGRILASIVACPVVNGSTILQITSINPSKEASAIIRHSVVSSPSMNALLPFSNARSRPLPLFISLAEMNEGKALTRDRLKVSWHKFSTSRVCLGAKPF